MELYSFKLNFYNLLTANPLSWGSQTIYLYGFYWDNHNYSHLYPIKDYYLYNYRLFSNPYLYQGVNFSTYNFFLLAIFLPTTLSTPNPIYFLLPFSLPTPIYNYPHYNHSKLLYRHQLLKAVSSIRSMFSDLNQTKTKSQGKVQSQIHRQYIKKTTYRNRRVCTT